MKGYVARKGDRYYAVIYEGLDPLTGRERRRWHPAGTCETQARLLATELEAARASDNPDTWLALIKLIYVQSSSPLNADSSDAIARMIRRYTSPKGVVIFDHTYNAGSGHAAHPPAEAWAIAQ